MKRRLYVAYGSNLNKVQMSYRCPMAKLYGIGVIQDHELQFKGYSQSAYATIAPKKGGEVPVAVWEIQPSDERALDRYEGYPSHYFKRTATVRLNSGEKVRAMVYIMNLKMRFGLPSQRYYQVVHQGYKDCGLEVKALNQALTKSAEAYYTGTLQKTINSFCDIDDTEEQDDEEDLTEEGGYLQT